MGLKRTNDTGVSIIDPNAEAARKSVRRLFREKAPLVSVGPILTSAAPVLARPLTLASAPPRAPASQPSIPFVHTAVTRPVIYAAQVAKMAAPIPFTQNDFKKLVRSLNGGGTF